MDEFFVYDDWDSGLSTDGKRLWSAISEEYANRASGDVNVVQAYEGAIWKDYEKPALMSNDKVGDIIGHSVDAAK